MHKVRYRDKNRYLKDVERERDIEIEKGYRD